MTPYTKRCTIQGHVPHKFMGLKIQKRDTPLRPIISSRSTLAYELVKELARVMRPLVGNSPHHIKNTKLM